MTDSIDQSSIDDRNERELSSLGWLFLISVILHVLTALAQSVLAQKGIGLSIEMNLIVSELSMLIPSLIYILAGNLNFREDLGFRPIKAGTFFMCILLAVLVTPVASFVNALSQLFVDNTMLRMSDSLLEGSNLAVMLLGALYGPICEEFVFRGVFNNRYGVYTGPLRAAFISALFFGLAHMNVNQAAYTFVLGFILALINDAAGSIYPSMIIHACINGANLSFLFASAAASRALGNGADFAAEAASAINKDILYVLIGVTLAAAIVCGALAIPCVIWIGEHEMGHDRLRRILGEAYEKKRWLTFPCVIAILFILFIMFGLNPVLSLVKNQV